MTNVLYLTKRILTNPILSKIKLLNTRKRSSLIFRCPFYVYFMYRMINLNPALLDYMHTGIYETSSGSRTSP